MNNLSRLVFTLAPFILAIPLCASVVAAVRPPRDPSRAEAAPDESQALKSAEARIAALAKEGGAEAAPAEPAAKPKHVKKAIHHARKRQMKARAARAGDPPKVAKVTNRRLTQSEVQGILAGSRDFTGADLSGMSLVGMDFSGVKFNRANLHNANFERANLAETDLELADLTGADLRGASLNQARMRGTRLAGARLDGALWIDKTVCKSGSSGSCIE